MLVVGRNHFYTSGFGDDISQIVNTVRVYGVQVDKIPIISTAEDASSQSSYGIRELTIKDTGIVTKEAADDRAQAELAIRKDPPAVGEVGGCGGETFKPGQMAYMFDPQSGVDGNYIMTRIVYDFPTFSCIQITLTLTKEVRRLAQYLKMHSVAIQSSGDFTNTDDMDFSWVFSFDDNTDIQSLISCAISGGSVISTGIDSQIVSVVKPISKAPSYVKFIASGTGISNATLQYSPDGGNAFYTVINNTLTAVPSTGNMLVLKVLLNSATAQLDSMALLWT
jgi:hypothetical protein